MRGNAEQETPTKRQSVHGSQSCPTDGVLVHMNIAATMKFEILLYHWSIFIPAISRTWLDLHVPKAFLSVADMIDPKMFSGELADKY